MVGEPALSVWIRGRGLGAAVVRASWVVIALDMLSAPAFAAGCAPELGQVVTVQGSAEVRRAGSSQWVALTPAGSLCAGDVVRVARVGRVGIRLSNATLLRLDQGTTLTLAPPDSRMTTVLEQLTGRMHVISRTPHGFGVRTPFINAAIDGTEFSVLLTESTGTVAVVEGRVLATNPAGSTQLVSGQAATAQRDGGPPRLDLTVRPFDAVVWMLHFPVVLDRPEGLGALPAGNVLEQALAMLRSGQAAEALSTLDGSDLSAYGAPAQLVRAAVLLQLGRVDQAQPLLAEAARLAPASSDVPALQAIIALAHNDAVASLALARLAVSRAPASPTALVALSYALQARFELAQALASVRSASDVAPDNPLVWARRAELELMTDDLEAALASARRAMGLGQVPAKAHLVLGFIHLARMDGRSATASFTEAARLDPADPLPWLGRGLANIRAGRLADGRAELEVAVLLDPRNALLRSYLGKAYFEEARNTTAAGEFALARELDPNDPTPYLYDAFRKLTENRPIEALRDLEQSIRRNDHRAVYRSRQTLDDDAATRSVSQASVYADLGFEQLALLEAVKSLQVASTNHAAHAFLADYYLSLPRHDMARDSELLQAQLLQPLVATPVQPRLSTHGLGFLERSTFMRVGAGEFGALLNRQGLNVAVGAALGSQGTRSSSLVASGLGESTAFSVGRYALSTDGFRPNHDQRLTVSNAFLQWQASPASGVQLELKRATRRVGDSALTFFDATNFDATVRSNFRADTLRLGGRHAPAPDTVLLASLIHRDQRDELLLPSFGVVSLHEDSAQLLELRRIHQAGSGSTTQGVSVLTGRMVATDTGIAPLPQSSRARDRHVNLYAYGDLRLQPHLNLTWGLSADDYADELVRVRQLNPKFGLLWTPTPDTTVRMAAFRALKRKVVSGQTIEPTHVAGFPQYLSGIADLNGTNHATGAIALARKLPPSAAFGVELGRRRIGLPAATLGGSASAEVWESWLKGFAYWQPAERTTLSLGLDLERLSSPDHVLTPVLLARSRTLTLPLEWRQFDPGGLSWSVKLTPLRQRGRFLDALAGSFEPGQTRATVTDLAVAYRLPRRLGVVALEVRNALDKHLDLQEINPQNSLWARRRALTMKLQLNY
jgi:tetratricopeptide (TPR) repeat protein